MNLLQLNGIWKDTLDVKNHILVQKLKLVVIRVKIVVIGDVKSGNENGNSSNGDVTSVPTKSIEVKPVNFFICMYCSKSYTNKYSKYNY